MVCIALQGCSDKKSQNNDVLYSSSKPYTRWWWFASEIDTNDVRNQLTWMHDHGFGGVEIAWLYPMGLDSSTVHPAFLSPEWSKAVVVAKRVADSLGMGCDYTYGTLWPFSDIDLPDGDQTRNYFDSTTIAQRGLTWDFPKVGRILNHLDHKAFTRYAARMNAALGEAYKGSSSGLFVDSWEVETEYLWTPGFASTFMDEHGYDIEPYLRDSLLYLPEYADVKYDYMSTLSGYVMREFYKPYADNARCVGAFSRAQCGGAPTDLLTAFTLVDIPETEAILYEPSFSKIAASAAALGDKQAVTSETFTCTYGWTGLLYKKGRGHSPHQGKEQIADLKLICDALFANGTNQIIWHGMPFNRVGDTSNFFYTTCQVSTSPLNNLSGEPLRQFNEYMTTVSGYMRRGKTCSQVAVYMPLEDSWRKGAYPDSIRKKMPWALGEYELRYIATPEELKGMAPLWINGHFLDKASFCNGHLTAGGAQFEALYSEVEYMDYNSLKIILRLAKSGLPVCMAAEPKEPGIVHHDDYGSLLSQLMALPNVVTNAQQLNVTALLEGDNLPDFWCRKDGDTFYYFFANPYSKTIHYPLPYNYAFGDHGTSRTVTFKHHGKSETTTLTFNPMESLLIEVTRRGIKQIKLNYIPTHLPE